MKILNREEVKRIVGQQPVAAGGGGGGDFDPTVLNGYATELWVDENYISIEFFSRLFQAHGTESGQQTDIDPNDMDSTITSIESMFGFWTDYYLSALGNGGGLGSTLYLSTLADVLISSPANNQVLTYNSTIGKWVNANAQAGVTQLSALSDVLLTNPMTDQVLIYDYSSSKWINSSLKTINGYSIIGTGNINASGGSGNYLPLTGGVMNGSIEQMIKIVTSTTDTWIAFYPSNIYRGAVGFTDNAVFFGGGDAVGYARIIINSSGYPQWGKYSGSFTFRNIHYDEISGATFQGDTTFANILTNSYLLTPHNQTTGLIMRHPISRVALGEIAWYYDHFFIGNLYNDTENCFISFFNNGYIRAEGNFGVGVQPEYKFQVAGQSKLQKDLGYNLSNFVSGQHDGPFEVGRSSNTMCVAIGVTDDNYGYMQCKGCNITSEGTLVINPYGGNVGIGTAPSYKLHVNGSIYATGAVTALSDARKKDVQGDAKIGVEQIADAPAVQFLWKGERAKEGVQVGTLAQYWQAVLPEVVMDKGGELSMQYGVAALVSAIITARKVVDHERRISELEKENERLRTEVEQLRLN